MEDPLARYRSASEANDMEAVMATLAPDPVLVSPLSGRMVFRGRDDVRVLLTAVYGSLRNFRWTELHGEGPTRVLVGHGKVGPVRLGDAMVLDLDAEGGIERFRPHLRPLLGLLMLGLVLGPTIARHPGMVARALRG